MNFVCTAPCLSRHARHLNVPYRGRHVPPTHFRSRLRLASGRGHPLRVRPCAVAPRCSKLVGTTVQSRCRIKPGNVLNRQLSDDINRAYQLREIEYSSGAWTRTRTIPASKAGGLPITLRRINTRCYRTLLVPRPSIHDTGRAAIAVSADPWVSTARLLLVLRTTPPMPAAAQPSILR